jgi:hypothetical protein
MGDTEVFYLISQACHRRQERHQSSRRCSVAAQLRLAPLQADDAVATFG